jgi:hypothetical protein
MKHARLLATAALLSVALVETSIANGLFVQAQPQLKTPISPDRPAYCASLDGLLRDLEKYYGELALVIGRTHQGHSVLITHNLITGSWTLITLLSGTGCVANFGTNMAGMSLLCERGALPLICRPKI